MISAERQERESFYARQDQDLVGFGNNALSERLEGRLRRIEEAIYTILELVARDERYAAIVDTSDATAIEMRVREYVNYIMRKRKYIADKNEKEALWTGEWRRG